MNDATFDRALELVMHQKLVTHEAAHAACALVLGLDVREVQAPRWSLGNLEHGDPDQSAGYALIGRPDDRGGQRKLALVVLAGRLEEGAPHWPPQWPLSLAPITPDERDLCDLVKSLDLDAAEYRQLTTDAYEIATSREYSRAHAVIAELLERDGRLDEITLRRVKAIATEEAQVQYTVKAAIVTATDQGEFTAIAAAYTADRVQDQIIPGAFRNTIDRWRASGKRIPLHWDHKSEAHNVIGSIDPTTMRETSEGLRVSGKLDIDTSDVAREAWRSMKNGTMSLSFGYITLKRDKRRDGINELHELDLFEISIVPHPANPDTRIVEMKSLDVVDLAADVELQDFRRKCHDHMLAYMGGDDADLLRMKSKRIEREFASIEVASFEC